MIESVTAAPRRSPSWLNLMLGAGAAALLATGVLLVGPSSQQATGQSRVIAAKRGVVQSTVSGSGDVEPASELNLGFKTSGVVSKVFISEGQHVAQGQLLAELDPSSAEVTLEQSRATLQAAEATLAQEQESGSETSGSAGATRGSSAQPGRSAINATNASETHKESAATREANIASARAAVSSDRLAIKSDEQALADTRLYAPEDGTIVSSSGEVGETVSATGTSRASSTSGSSSGAGGSSAGGSGGRSSGGSGSSGSSGSGSSGSGSGSSAFAVLADLQHMQVVAPLSESEAVHVRTGQPATVTIEALEGVKLAAHVSKVASLATSNSGVVSYDVTFRLDQLAGGLRPGMSASAEVVVKQEEGVSVPTSAISGGAVTVVRNGSRVRQPVVTGLAGNSSTIVLSGLQVGEQVVLPLARSSSTSLFSNLTRRAGGGALGGGGGLGGAGAVFFRGAGPGGG